ncbi:GvpL/GvpF family gas vesicle protein [Roseomonas frigidaquae]|uniref:GvpL/GvpF family gas vesicle protein n=1 Tax=Falsiroseomonas frigidaquae TaxID=487318 RepID=A0ABX1EUD6_9PROT|nr:GvpL/GvpF family gas vesicle protein [Falsiroseomonas frigidaquae]NKE44246.1 GvpL/GvpF family gas vesicle protein [Falsiroseomonas frigidaquae]
MSGLYVFGVVQADALADASAFGPGLGGAQLRLLPGEQGLAALVADAPAEPPEATRRNMLGHTAVLERAIAAADVLPVRFATVAPDATRLAGCLDRNAAAFRVALAAIAGRIELGVKASWQEGVAVRDILAADAGLRALRDRLQNRPATQTYQERIELGRRVEAAMNTMRDRDAAMLAARLDPLAERCITLKPVDDSMVLNRAFLVRRDRETEFDAAMRELGEAQGARMSFRYIGPVPPYNFVTLRADWLGEAA